jgi:hypothetical protein
MKNAIVKMAKPSLTLGKKVGLTGAIAVLEGSTLTG